MAFSDKFKLNDFWRSYINKTIDCKYNICIGSYRSSKSVSNMLAFALHLEVCEDLLHLVIASTTTLAESILTSNDPDISLPGYFGNRFRRCKYKGFNAASIKTNNGIKTIIFVGGSMANSYQSIRGLSIGSIVIEEANLIHPTMIDEALGRILMSKNPKVFLALNPGNTKSYIYKRMAEWKALGNDITNFSRSNIFQNPAITPERIAEIVAEYDPESLYYKAYILGEDVEVDGIVYNIRDYNVINSNDYTYRKYLVVADPGINLSATGFILMGLTYNDKDKQNEVHVIKEYLHRNADCKNGADVKLPRDYANDLVEFYNDVYKMTGKYCDIQIDRDITFLRELEIAFKANRLNTNYISYVVKKEIEERIKTGVNLLYKGKLRFDVNCVHTKEHFVNAVYDKKKYDEGKMERVDDPATANIDLLDATEYGFQYFINYLY